MPSSPQTPLDAALQRGDRSRVAQLLNQGAPDDAWARACAHGAAPKDWASIDRDAHAFLPATGDDQTCARCQGQGWGDFGLRSAYGDEYGDDVCDACFGSGKRTAPTPALWVARAPLTRAQAAALLDPDAPPTAPSASDSAPWAAQHDRFVTVCNRLTTHTLGPAHVAYTRNAKPVGGYTHAAYHNGSYICWDPTARGWRLPTRFEWRACALSDVCGFTPLPAPRATLCWHTSPAYEGRLHSFRLDPTTSPPRVFDLPFHLDAFNANAALRVVRDAPMPPTTP